MPYDELMRNNAAIGVGSRAPGETPPQAGWESLNVYDAPGVILGQLAGGEGSWSNMVGAALRPERLSPEARKDLGKRMFGEVQNPLAKTLVGLATNPWVWLYFATSPVGGQALRAGGSLFKTSKAWSIFQKRSMGFLHQMKSHMENFGEVSGTMTAITRNLDEAAREVKEILGPAEVKLQTRLSANVLKRTGKKAVWKDGAWMVPEMYEVGSAERQVLDELGTIGGALKSGALDGRELGTPGLKMRVYLKTGLDDQWLPLDEDQRVKDLFEKVSGDALPEYTQDEVNRYLKLKQVQESLRDKAWARFVEDPNFEVRVEEARKKVSDPAFDKKNFAHDSYVDPRVKQGNPFDTTVMSEAWEKYWGEQPDFMDVLLSNEVTAETAAAVPKVAEANAAFLELKNELGPEFDEWLGATEKAAKHSFVKALGDEEHYKATGMFKADRMKTRRVISSMNRQMNQTDPYGKMTSTLYGMDALTSMLGVERLKMIQTVGGVGAQTDAVADIVEKMVGGQLNWDLQHWQSRNVFSPARLSDGSKATLQLGDVVQQRAVELAPHAATISFADKIAPITPREVFFSEDFIDKLDRLGILSGEGRRHASKVRRIGVEMRTRAVDQKTLMTWDPSRLAESMDRHHRNLGQLFAFDTAPVAAEALADDAARVSNMMDEFKKRTTKIGVRGDFYAGIALADSKEHGIKGLLNEEQLKKISNGDILDRVYVSLPSPAAQEIFRNSAVPSMVGNAGDQYLAIYNAHTRTKEMAAWWAKSPLGRGLKKYGGKWGAGIVDRLEKIGSFEENTRMGSLSDGLAKYLYATHLGVNVASMLMNMTQPLLLASLISKNPLSVLKAYGEAVSEMGTYAQKRAGMGLKFITAQEKADLVRNTFEHADELGIGPDMFASLDSHLAASKGSMSDRVFEVMMKGFEKTEWMNRVVAGKLLKGAYKEAGREASGSGFLSDLRRFVLQTQFGQSDVNTPMIFEKGILSNRLVRQFFTFPLRSVTGATSVMPGLQSFEGDQSYVKNMANVFFRGMGMSAMLYEVGKGAIGADLSRGLFAGSLTGLVGGDRMLDPDQSPIPVPPVVGIPVDLIRGWANDDAQMLSSAVARLVPGGVALNRAMGFLPELPRGGVSGMPGSLQTQSVGWNEMQNGMVPVYNAQGLLKEYRSPAEIVAKAMGADLGKWKQQGELDNWLVKHKAEIDGMRHEAVRALYTGDMARVARLRAQVQKKFGVPLTITKAQITEYARNRATPRTERILDTYGSGVRAPYAAAVAGSGAVPGMDPSRLGLGGSSASRDDARPGLEAKIQELRKRVEQVGPAGNQEGQGFTGFGAR